MRVEKRKLSSGNHYYSFVYWDGENRVRLKKSEHPKFENYKDAFEWSKSKEAEINYLKEAYEAEKVMAGISAGSICWFEEGVTNSVPGKLLNLGFIKGSNCPHYDGEAERRGSYHKPIKDGMKPGYACDDGVAAHFVNDELVRFVNSRPTAKAYRVEFQSEVIESSVEPSF